MMIISKKILFSLVLSLGITGSAFAQNEKKNPPKEGKPPVVVPKEKLPRPKDDKGPRKPGFAVVLWKAEAGSDI
jgi:hypothetical protein